MKKILLFFITAATVTTACNEPQSDKRTTMSTTDSTTSFSLADAKTAIEADNAIFAADVKKGDSAALAEHYHSNAQFLMPNSEPVMRANMAATMGGMLRMGIKDVKLTLLDLTGNEDLLLETGAYEMYGDKNTLLDKGKYLVGWKKENGKWKIYRDMINTSMPTMQKGK